MGVVHRRYGNYGYHDNRTVGAMQVKQPSPHVMVMLHHNASLVIIGMNFIFCGFYRYVNCGESLTN